MRDLNSLKPEVINMAETVLGMWKTGFRAFMEHDLDLISEVLEKENKVNDWEKTLTVDLIELIKADSKEKEKKVALIYEDIVGDLEIIGDYCKDILERVHIKIDEKFLFSDEAVQDYTELYSRVELALVKFLSSLKNEDKGSLKDILHKQNEFEKLVEKYRQRHNQRLIKGLCSPLASNMFLNMLDFTAQVYRHTAVMAKNLIV